jgi:dolichol kinase
VPITKILLQSTLACTQHVLLGAEHFCPHLYAFLCSDDPSAAVLMINAARLVATGCGWLHDPQLVATASRSEDSRELAQIRGPLAYVLALLAVVLGAWGQHPAGVVAAAIMCGGDGLADVAGSRWGKGRPLPWNAGKSWPGSAAMFVGASTTAIG